MILNRRGAARGLDNGALNLWTPRQLQRTIGAHATPLTSRRRLAAASAVAWILAFNARWQVGLRPLGMAEEAVVDLLREWNEGYL